MGQRYSHYNELETIPYKTHLPSQRDRRLVNLLLFIGFSLLIFAGILFALFFPGGTSHAENNIQIETTSHTEYGNFINELKQSKFDPILQYTLWRKDFSVEGKMVTLGTDNIQIFEYTNSSNAKEEALTFVKNYKENNNNHRVTWNASQKLKQIYTKNNLIIFYMGNQKNIMNTLGTLAGPSLIENQS